MLVSGSGEPLVYEGHVALGCSAYIGEKNVALLSDAQLTLSRLGAVSTEVKCAINLLTVN